MKTNGLVMLQRILQAVFGKDPDPGACGCARNPAWEKASKEFLIGKVCIVCGGTRGMQTHHKYPFHLFPDREMDSKYWVPICTDGPGGMNCHRTVGHGGNFKNYNPHVESDAGAENACFRQIQNHTVTE